VLDSNSYSGDTSELEGAPDHSPETPPAGPSSSGHSSDDLYSELEETVDEWVEEYSEDSLVSKGQEIFDRLTDLSYEDLEELLPKKVPCSRLYDGTAFTYSLHKDVTYLDSSRAVTFKGRLGKRSKSSGNLQNKDLWSATYEFGSKRVLVPITDLKAPDKVKFWAIYTPAPEVSLISMDTIVKTEDKICPKEFFHTSIKQGQDPDNPNNPDQVYLDADVKYMADRQARSVIAARGMEVARAAKQFRIEQANENKWDANISREEESCEDLATCSQIKLVKIEHAFENDALMSHLTADQRVTLTKIKRLDDQVVDEMGYSYASTTRTAEDLKTQSKFLITEMCHLQVAKPQNIYDDKYQQERAAQGLPINIDCIQSSNIGDYVYTQEEEGEETTRAQGNYPHCLTREYGETFAARKAVEDIDKAIDLSLHVATVMATQVPVAGEGFQAYLCHQMSLEIPLEEDFGNNKNAYRAAVRIHDERVTECYNDVIKSTLLLGAGALKYGAVISKPGKLQAFLGAEKYEKLRKVANFTGDTLAVAAGTTMTIDALADTLVDGPNLENMTELGLGVASFALLRLKPPYKKQTNPDGSTSFVDVAGKKNVLTAAKCEVCAEPKAHILSSNKDRYESPGFKQIIRDISTRDNRIIPKDEYHIIFEREKEIGIIQQQLNLSYNQSRDFLEKFGLDFSGLNTSTEHLKLFPISGGRSISGHRIWGELREHLDKNNIPLSRASVNGYLVSRYQVDSNKVDRFYNGLLAIEKAAKPATDLQLVRALGSRELIREGDINSATALFESRAATGVQSTSASPSGVLSFINDPTREKVLVYYPKGVRSLVVNGKGPISELAREAQIRADNTTFVPGELLVWLKERLRVTSVKRGIIINEKFVHLPGAAPADNDCIITAIFTEFF
jgi:hypothetical protein